MTAIEAGEQPRIPARESNLINARNIFAGARRQAYFEDLPQLFSAQVSLGSTNPEQIPFIKDSLIALISSGLSPVKDVIARIASKPYKPMFPTDKKGSETAPLPSQAEVDTLNIESHERSRNRRFEQILGLTPFEPKPRGKARVALILAGAGVALFTACGPSAPKEVVSSTPIPARPTATPVGTGETYVPTGIKDTDAIGQKLVDQNNKTQKGEIIPESEKVPESDILKFNAAIRARQSATAEAGNSSKDTPPAKGFENGMISAEAYTKAEYITWDIPGGGGKAEAIALVLGPNEKFTLPKAAQVAAVPRTLDNKPNGYRITIIDKDGSQINITGDVAPTEGIGEVGKEFPSGTVIGTSRGSGLTNFPGYPYTQLVIYDNSSQLRIGYPDQTKFPPKPIDNKIQAQDLSTPDPGITVFDVKPFQGG